MCRRRSAPTGSSAAGRNRSSSGASRRFDTGRNSGALRRLDAAIRSRHARRRMIRSFIFSDGKLVGRDLELEALRLVRADKGLMLWVDLDNPTDDEAKAILEGVFAFHPVAVEDCLTPSSLPKIEDYDDYLFLVTHGVDFTRQEKFGTTELDLFLGKDYLVTFHRSSLRSVQTAMERCVKNTGVIARGPDRLAHQVLDLLIDNY